MNQLKNIRTVAGLFFYFFGFLIFSLIFLIHNHFYGELPVIILKIVNLPFVLVSLLYGLSGLRISLGEDVQSDMIDAILIFIGVFAFVFVVYLDFAFKDFI